MKRLLAALGAITVLFSFAACGSNASDEKISESDVSMNSNSYLTLDESQTQSETTTKEESNMQIEIIIGNKTFSAVLYDNAAASALNEMLPITLNMSELNGNEKYYYLDKNLPIDSGRPSGIATGDIMLYGNNCLVLFYESFSTIYSYTPLGRIDEPEGLAAALGSGSVQVTFRKG